MVWFRDDGMFFAVNPTGFRAYGDQTIVFYDGPGNRPSSIRLPGDPEAVAAEFGVDLSAARDLPTDRDDESDEDDRRRRDD